MRKVWMKKEMSSTDLADTQASSEASEDLNDGAAVDLDDLELRVLVGEEGREVELGREERSSLPEGSGLEMEFSVGGRASGEDEGLHGGEEDEEERVAGEGGRPGASRGRSKPSAWKRREESWERRRRGDRQPPGGS